MQGMGMVTAGTRQPCPMQRGIATESLNPQTKQNAGMVTARTRHPCPEERGIAT